MTPEAKVLARMRKNPVALTLREVAQGAGLPVSEAREALAKLERSGKVAPFYWRLVEKP